MAKKSTKRPVLLPPSADAATAESELTQNAAAFSKSLHAWYRDNARELPWRGVHDPYATWLSEIMLQQTRVATVIDRYQEFLRKFPTIRALAEADEADVLALWSGLGYYRRARMLHRGAQFVMREPDGHLPRTANDLRTLPGVGAYTAAAIASIAFGESIAVVDGNVERVLFRILGQAEEKTAAARSRLARIAQQLVPPVATRRSRSNPPGDHNQAMMELGATLCTPRSPLCLQCPVVDFCRTRGEHTTAPRAKQNSRTVAYLLSLRKAGTMTQVLLERRATNSSIMPGMYELPPLPLEAIESREPVLRVRHAITNTNYYALIFSEGAPATAPSPEVEEDFFGVAEYETVDTSSTDPETQDQKNSLLNQIPAAASDLFWTPTRRLRSVPLTGLARKSLQRLGVMELPPVKIG